jgi:hypothetical protein
MTAYRFESKLKWNWIILYRVETNSCGMHIMRDKQAARVWCGNMNTYRYNTYRVFRADKWHDSISSRDEIVSYRIVSKRTRAGCISCGTSMYRECLVREHKYRSLQYIASVSCRQMTWQHIISRWNCIIPYRVETNSFRMHIMRDKHVPRVFGAGT